MRREHLNEQKKQEFEYQAKKTELRETKKKSKKKHQKSQISISISALDSPLKTKLFIENHRKFENFDRKFRPMGRTRVTG